MRPKPFTRASLAVAAAWLAGTALSFFAFRLRFPRFHGTDLVAFLGTGLLAEELLFRGAVYALASRALPDVRIGPLAMADLVSAALFSCAHLQYFDWKLTPAALAQVAIISQIA